MSRIILLNKPFDVLCQFRASEGRKTLKDFVSIPAVYPAGRLDADSEGLVVLTGDGALQNRISAPEHKLVKTYFVEVEGVATPAAIRLLCEGIDLRDFITQPAQAMAVGEPTWLWPRQPPVRFRKNIPTSWIQISIAEGKNRQVRRMTAAVGFPTLRLIRYSIGDWNIEGLPPGESKEIESFVNFKSKTSKPHPPNKGGRSR
jgi:23S rRNA pseudouridine2457 synthase